MLIDSKSVDTRTRLNLIFFSLFLVIVFAMGGGSRGDALSQPFVRLAAILLIVLNILQMDRAHWQQARAPVLFLLAIAAVIAIQLVPLPYGLWASLPGHSIYAEHLDAAQIPHVWRPLSLTPDLTLNSLLSVLPPLAAVLGFVLLDRDDRRLLVPILLIGIAFSAVIGVLQISSGALYFYRITNEGSAVGVFANRNHQAVLLAAAMPLLAAWLVVQEKERSRQTVRLWIALCCAAAIFPLLLVTGSRSGLILGAGAALASLLLFFLERRRRPSGPTRSPLVWVLPLLVALVAIGFTIWSARDEALRRFTGGQPGVDMRTENLPIFMQMIRDFFPIGSGFGSFDTVFRVYEPYDSLQYAYLNQAHNDLLQIVMEGGVLPALLLVVFLVWFVVRAFRLWLIDGPSSTRPRGRAAVIVVLLLLSSSAVDYPLRTPLAAVVMTIMCLWMQASRPPPMVVSS